MRRKDGQGRSGTYPQSGRREETETGERHYRPLRSSIVGQRIPGALSRLISRPRNLPPTTNPVRVERDLQMPKLGRPPRLGAAVTPCHPPCRKGRAASSVRERTSSLAKIRDRFASTVLTLM
jgi:hypothetical protein